MQLKIAIKRGGEVKWRGEPDNGPVYYGGPPPETGEWKLDINQLEAYLCKALQDRSYGESIDTFLLGFEIAELDGWGPIFTKQRDRVSHLPKIRTLLSVGQLNWPDVKDLSEAEQFERFSAMLLQAIARAGAMKRKPRHFDAAAFVADVTLLLFAYPIDSAASPAV